MPRVRKSLFLCPLCQQPTHVLRSRRALAQRLIRYRQCPAGHRTRTAEIVDLPRPTASVRLVLTNLIDSVGMSAESNPNF